MSRLKDRKRKSVIKELTTSEKGSDSTADINTSSSDETSYCSLIRECYC